MTPAEQAAYLQARKDLAAEWGVPEDKITDAHLRVMKTGEVTTAFTRGGNVGRPRRKDGGPLNDRLEYRRAVTDRCKKRLTDLGAIEMPEVELEGIGGGTCFGMPKEIAAGHRQQRAEEVKRVLGRGTKEDMAEHVNRTIPGMGSIAAKVKETTTRTASTERAPHGPAKRGE